MTSKYQERFIITKQMSFKEFQKYTNISEIMDKAIKKKNMDLMSSKNEYIQELYEDYMPDIKKWRNNILKHIRFKSDLYKSPIIYRLYKLKKCSVALKRRSTTTSTIQINKPDLIAETFDLSSNMSEEYAVVPSGLNNIGRVTLENVIPELFMNPSVTSGLNKSKPVTSGLNNTGSVAVDNVIPDIFVDPPEISYEQYVMVYGQPIIKSFIEAQNKKIQYMLNYVTSYVSECINITNEVPNWESFKRSLGPDFHEDKYDFKKSTSVKINTTTQTDIDVNKNLVFNVTPIKSPAKKRCIRNFESPPLFSSNEIVNTPEQTCDNYLSITEDKTTSSQEINKDNVKSVAVPHKMVKELVHDPSHNTASNNILFSYSSDMCDNPGRSPTQRNSFTEQVKRSIYGKNLDNESVTIENNMQNRELFFDVSSNINRTRIQENLVYNESFHFVTNNILLFSSSAVCVNPNPVTTQRNSVLDQENRPNDRNTLNNENVTLESNIENRELLFDVSCNINPTEIIGYLAYNQSLHLTSTNISHTHSSDVYARSRNLEFSNEYVICEDIEMKENCNENPKVVCCKEEPNISSYENEVEFIPHSPLPPIIIDDENDTETLIENIGTNIQHSEVTEHTIFVPTLSSTSRQLLNILDSDVTVDYNIEQENRPNDRNSFINENVTVEINTGNQELLFDNSNNINQTEPQGNIIYNESRQFASNNIAHSTYISDVYERSSYLDFSNETIEDFEMKKNCNENPKFVSCKEQPNRPPLSPIIIDDEADTQQLIENISTDIRHNEQAEHTIFFPTLSSCSRQTIQSNIPESGVIKNYNIGNIAIHEETIINDVSSRSLLLGIFGNTLLVQPNLLNNKNVVKLQTCEISRAQFVPINSVDLIYNHQSAPIILYRPVHTVGCSFLTFIYLANISFQLYITAVNCSEIHSIFQFIRDGTHRVVFDSESMRRLLHIKSNLWQFIVKLLCKLKDFFYNSAISLAGARTEETFLNYLFKSVPTKYEINDAPVYEERNNFVRHMQLSQII